MAKSFSRNWFNRFLISIVVIGTATFLLGVSHYTKFQRNAMRLQENREFEAFLRDPADPVEAGDARLYFQDAYELANSFCRDFPTCVPPESGIDEAAIEKFEKLSSQYHPLFELIDKIAESKKLSFAYDEQNGLLPEPLKVIKVANALQAKARIADARQDWESAVLAAKQMIEIARKMEQAPSLMNALVSENIRHYGIQVVYKLITVEQLSSQDAEQIFALLDLCDPCSSYTRSLKFERYMVMRNAAHSTSLNSVLFHWFSGNHYLNKMSRVIAISSTDITAPVPPKPYSLIDKTLEVFGQHDIEMAYLSIRNSFAQELVNIRAAKILLALYQSEHPKSQWTIEQALQAGLKIEDIRDPFSDQDLILSNVDGLVTVYSVGQNGIDEGGQSGSDDSGLIPQEFVK